MLPYLLPVAARRNVQGQGAAFLNRSLTGLLPGLPLEVLSTALASRLLFLPVDP